MTRILPEREQDLVNAIIQLIQMRGGWVIRINSGMTVVEDVNGKKRMIRGAPAGTSDIIACYRSKFVAIECKIGRNKMTVYQEDFMQQICRAGGLHVLAYSLDDVIGALDLIEGKEVKE